MNNKKVVVPIDIQAKLDSAQRSLEEFQKQLQQLKLGPNLSREFSAVFSGLEKELDKLRQKTASGELSLIDAHSAERTISKIDGLYSSLIQKLEKEGVASAGLKKDQVALGALLGAQKEYSEALRETERTQDSLNRKLEQEKKKKEELAALQRKQTIVSEGEYSGQRLKVGQQKKNSEAAAKKLVEAEQALAQKVADSKGTYSMSQKDVKGSPLRKTKAYKEYKEALEAATAAEKAYREEKEKLDTYTTEAKQAEAMKVVEEAIDEAEKRLKSFNNEQAKTAKTEAFAKIKKDLQEIKDIDWNGLDIDLDSINNIEELEQALSQLKIEAGSRAAKALATLKGEAKKTGEVIEDFGEDIHGAVRAVEEMDESVRNSEAFAARIKSFLGLSGAAQVLKSALRDAMQTIKELDATMTEMAVVTDLTVGDYWDQLPEYSQRASDLGVSINSAYKAATLYYQQGLKTNEVNAISAETLKMAKIAGLDAADATNKMTAALRGFNMELNEESAQRVSDVYSELAAITAADTKEIANAMTKTASIASSAGMEFETTAAFLSQIIETTRESAETAGTAMKTVIARFQELKKSPDEIGEVDGEIVDANAIETALRSVGVSLRDTSGQFRDLDDVFLELSSKWDSLDKNTQRYIATIAAGSRQQSRFIAMMSDYSRTQELVTAANNSAGASNKQFEKTMDSLEAKVEKLKNAWHEFTMGILESDLVKFGVDVLTKFLEIINKATSSIGGLGNSLSKIITILGVFKLASKIFDKIRAPMISFFADVVKEAGMAGYEAGRTFDQNVREGVQDNKANQLKSSPKQQSIYEKLGLGFVDTFKNSKKLSKEIEVLKKKRKELDEPFAEFEESAEDYEKRMQELGKIDEEITSKSQKRWEQVGKGISEVGGGITVLGVGISLLGGLLSSLGLEELGSTLSTIGQVITFIGSALMMIPPILTLISSHPIVAAVVASLTVILTLITLIVTKAQKNSPEARLAAIADAAEAAADAADRATESYQNLSTALEEFGDKYKNLEELTRGTQEWREAVNSINSEVLDLIDKYPELQEFLTSKSGVLTLDLDDEKLQSIVIEAEMVSIGTKNAATVANAEAELAQRQHNINTFISQVGERAREEFLRDNFLDRTIENWSSGQTGDAGDLLILPFLAALETLAEGAEIKAQKEETLEKLAGQEKSLALALAKGIIISDTEGKYIITNGREGEAIQLGLSGEYLNEIAPILDMYANSLKIVGQELLAAEEQLKNNFEAAANNAKNLIQLSKEMDFKEQQENWNYIDAVLNNEDYARIYQEELNKILWGQTSFEPHEQDKIIEKTYGRGAKRQGDKIVLNGETIAEGIADDFLQSLYANQLATNRFAKTGESTYDMVKVIMSLSNDAYITDDTISRLFLASDGGELTQEDLGAITNSGMLNDTAIWTYWASLTEEQRDLFGSGQAFKDYIQNAIDKAYEGFGSAEELLSGRNITDNFLGVNARGAHALAKVATSDTMTSTEAASFVAQFNKIVSDQNLTEDQKGYFSQLVASMSTDPTNREGWEDIIGKLAKSGMDITSPIGKEIETFLTNSIKALDSRYSDTHLRGLGVSENLIQNYQNATGEELEKFHKTFTKWKKDYDNAQSESKKAEHELINQVIEAMVDSYEKQINAYEEGAKAISEANEKLISSIFASIEATRQARENDKTETEISDMRNRLAYLRSDTSGGNALAILELQKEIEEAEEDYQDSLIDQSIQKLEDANAKAAEQRETQIQLMRDQLEAYKDSEAIVAAAKAMVDEAVEKLTNGEDIENTALGKLVAPENFTSAFEESSFWNGLREKLGLLVEKPKPEEPMLDGTESPAPTSKLPLHGGPVKQQIADFGDGEIVQDQKDQRQSDSILGDYREKAQMEIYNSYISTEDIKSSKEIKAIYDSYLSELSQQGLQKKTVDFEEFIRILSGRTISKGGGRTPDFQNAIFKTGGLADFTGPAWLDGTKSRPEYVLNSAQTERFFSLVDVLERFNTDNASAKAGTGGDNHFEIEINVDKLENDYDVEQLADKIRRMIYDDATYRNVNVVGLMR